MLKLSIVTPSYNQGSFLEEAIRSVLDQAIPDMEYVVMDGGSTDGSVEILKRYSKKIKGWVSEKDGGQADGVNKGIAQLNGDIIGWINSDDFFLPGGFKKVLDYFEAHPQTDGLYGDVLSVDDHSKLINVMRFEPYSLQDLMRFRVISQPGVFFRRSLWEKTGGLDLSYAYLLDHHLWLRMFRVGKFDYVPEPLAAARYHAAAKNRAHTEDFGKEAYRLTEWMLTDPDFKDMAQPISREIHGGAAWLDAHYLSDGGQAWKSLAAYGRAFRLFPSRVLEDKKRLFLTGIMALSPSLAQAVYVDRAAKRLESLKEYEALLPYDKAL